MRIFAAKIWLPSYETSTEGRTTFSSYARWGSVPMESSLPTRIRIWTWTCIRRHVPARRHSLAVPSSSRMELREQWFKSRFCWSQEFLGRPILAMNVMWKYREQVSDALHSLFNDRAQCPIKEHCDQTSSLQPNPKLCVQIVDALYYHLIGAYHIGDILLPLAKSRSEMPFAETHEKTNTKFLVSRLHGWALGITASVDSGRNLIYKMTPPLVQLITKPQSWKRLSTSHNYHASKNPIRPNSPHIPFSCPTYLLFFGSPRNPFPSQRRSTFIIWITSPTICDTGAPCPPFVPPWRRQKKNQESERSDS